MQAHSGRRSRVHLVLFCSEGDPFDGGRNLLAGVTPLVKAAEASFDSVRVHTPRSLVYADSAWSDFVSDVTEKIVSDKRYSEDLPWNSAWARVGLVSWKPRLLVEELVSNETHTGDIVFYHDADLERYPDYLQAVHRWPRWLRSRMRNLDVLVFDDNGASLSSDVKPELIEKLVPESDVSHLKHLWSGAIAVRKNQAGLMFANAWSEHSDFEALSPFTKLPPPKGFVWNSVDQAVLSALWHSEVFADTSIRRDVQYLYRSRVIPPPSPLRLFVTKHTRRLRKKALALTGRYSP